LLYCDPLENAGITTEKHKNAFIPNMYLLSE